MTASTINIVGDLTILTWKNLCLVLNPLQKLIEMQGVLLLTFFICLHNELSSFNFVGDDT